MHIENQSALTLLTEQWPLLQANATEVIVLSGREHFRPTGEAPGVKYFLPKTISMHAWTQQINRLRR
jgi:hypothetical protein